MTKKLKYSQPYLLEVVSPRDVGCQCTGGSGATSVTNNDCVAGVDTAVHMCISGDRDDNAKDAGWCRNGGVAYDNEGFNGCNITGTIINISDSGNACAGGLNPGA